MANERKNRYRPDFVLPPGNTLHETIEAMGMTQAQLAARMDCTEKHITGIIKGKSPISEETALKLERVLGIDASFWRNLEHQYRRYLAEKEEREQLSSQKEWLKKFPVRDMISLGWIDKHKDPVDQLSALLDFFGVATWESWKNVWANQTSFRKSRAFQSNPNFLAAWLRRGEILAEFMDCEPFDKKRFKEALPELRQLSTLTPEDYLPELKALCSKCGVAVVFLPELPEVRISGATRWLHKDKALIQLSDRYKKDDHFWFTFFHEAGHILLHGKKEVFIEEESQKDKDVKEQEADIFARDTLIHPKKYARLIHEGKPDLQKIRSFAQGEKITPGIVVGRLQHDGIIEFTVGNALKKSIRLV